MAKNPEKARVLSRKMTSVVLWIPLGVIAFYRYFISPIIGPRCRFYPTCSEYSQEAYRRFGLIKGTKLTIQRLLKCHPWHAGGIDHVPDDKTINHS